MFSITKFKNLKTRKQCTEYVKKLDVVGSGSARIVYDLKDGRVIKAADPYEDIFVGAAIEHNRNEYYISKCIPNKVAQCLEKHPKFWWIISEYCTPIVFLKQKELNKFYRMCREKERIFSKYDLHLGELYTEEHWGINKEDRLVVLDYGATNDTIDRWYWHI